MCGYILSCKLHGAIFGRMYVLSPVVTRQPLRRVVTLDFAFEVLSVEGVG